MAKKSRRTQEKESQILEWYKWEFLRRNRDYQRDYQEFAHKFADWFAEHGFWFDQNVRWSRDELRFFAKNIAPKAKAICKRWVIRDPIPPDWEFSKSGSFFYNSESEVLLPTELEKGVPGALWDLSAILSVDDPDFAKKLPADTNRRGSRPSAHELTLTVDLRRSLSEIMRRARDRISARKRVYDRMHPLPPKVAPSVRRRLDTYDTYLRIWDLRSQGKTFPAIGEALFPGMFTPAQRAFDGYRAAEKLINGGYKELR